MFFKYTKGYPGHLQVIVKLEYWTWALYQQRRNSGSNHGQIY